MNLPGEKQASIQLSHTVCTAGAVSDDTAVCDRTFARGSGEVPRPDAPLVSALPFSEMEGVLHALARMLERRDHHTAAHCERIAFSAMAMGVAMEFDSASVLLLYVGGYLHDIGKVGIPDAVLFKPGGLTGPEWETMRTHPVRGEEICAPLKSLRGVLPLIRHHHEKWDGSGYPDGLRGAGIPLLARVLQVVDIYDALTHPRPYKQAYTSAHALEILQQETARGWRDPQITSLFIRGHEQMLVENAEPHDADAALCEIGDSLRNLHTHLTQ